MATSSQVKSGLDEIASIIAAQRAALEKVISNAANASSELGAIPADYADLIATINAYGAGDAFEELSKAEKAKLQSEFTALKSAADTIAGVAL